MEALLAATDAGLYCPAGDFYIDPWRPVPRAIVTHAHSDHARPGSGRYLCAAPGELVLRQRLGDDALIDAIPYGEPIEIGGVRVSLHPAGHVLGSAQVRLEQRGQICVMSGDYKRQHDPTCAAFEPLRCHHFITESTFGLPIYRWPDPAETLSEINQWWRQNQHDGRTSLLFAYALGKAQRVLSGLDAGIGPILAHGAVMRMVEAYRAAGVDLPAVQYADPAASREHRGWALVLAPPSAMNSPWSRRFAPSSTAMASGWMRLRGPRRRRAIDRGFVLSDHADWNGLLQSIQETGAEQVWVTHGYTAPLIAWLREQGLAAEAIRTQFEGELADAGDATTEAEQA